MFSLSSLHIKILSIQLLFVVTQNQSKNEEVYYFRHEKCFKYWGVCQDFGVLAIVIFHEYGMICDIFLTIFTSLSHGAKTPDEVFYGNFETQL